MNRTFVAALAAFFICCVSAFGATPKVKTDEIKTEVKEINTVEVSVDKGAGLGMFRTFGAEECFFEELRSDSEGVHKFIFQAKKAGTYLIVFWTVGEAEGVPVRIIARGSEPPAPPVPPTPIPDGKFGLAPKMYGYAMSVTEASRVKGAAALVKSFDGMRAAIAAGTLTNPEEILKKTTESNVSALANAGVPREHWESAFKSLQEAVYQLYSDKKLSVASDYAEAWGEIASGLRAVK